MSQAQKRTAKKKPTPVEKERTITVEKPVEQKPADGIYPDLKGVAKALAQFAASGSKMNKKAVHLTKIAVYKIENGEKRELTTKEASAFVRSGYSNPPK